MPCSKKYTRVTEVRKAVAGWPELYVIGNKPYAKGCYLFRKGRYDAPPQLLHVCETNWAMLEIVSRKAFHPDMFKKKEEALQHFFPTAAVGEPVISAKYLVKKAWDHLAEGQELVEGLLGIDPLQEGVLDKVKELLRSMR